MEKLPVYAKGGFSVRAQKPVGFAATHEEATAIVLNMGRNLYGSANGQPWENVYVGVERLKDDQGEYFVGRREMREIK